MQEARGVDVLACLFVLKQIAYTPRWIRTRLVAPKGAKKTANKDSSLQDDAAE